MEKFLTQIPSIHLLQKRREFIQLTVENSISVETLTKWAQEEVQKVRMAILKKQWEERELSRSYLVDYILFQLQARVARFNTHNLQKVINATGTILHTNLGRARLSQAAMEHVKQTSVNYTNLEYDLETGERSSRHQIIEELLTEITGAEAAMVVNNNAAAVFFILRVFAKDKEVIVSRGELVEIGGSFRVPSIMEESGARLKEVGTTNKTHVLDYENAITEQTAILMKVHQSNFKFVGFTSEVGIESLVQLANSHPHLLTYEDLGSGVLCDFEYNTEPVISKVIQKGVDLVSFSGDKLLGGSQAGIIVGKKTYIEQLKKHQLARVLRVDKMTLAALEETIRHYLRGDLRSIPTLHDLLLPLSDIKKRIERFLEGMARNQGKWSFATAESVSQVGGGAFPGLEIPTIVLIGQQEPFRAEQIARILRMGAPPVITRIKEDKIILDLRTVNDTEIDQLVACCQNVNQLSYSL